MLTQIIKGEELLPIKFHGEVKHLIFECNQCHENFVRPQSYLRKQSKKRAHACCFCSPRCRSKYMFVNKTQQVSSQPARQNLDTPELPPKVEEPELLPPSPVNELPAGEPNKGFFSNFLKNLLGK